MESGRGDNVQRMHTFFRPRYSSYARARERGALPPTLWAVIRQLELYRIGPSGFKCFVYPHQFEELRRAVSNDLAAYGCTPNEHNFKDIREFVGKEIDCPDGTPKTVYLSIAQGFGPKQKKESYVNILSEGDEDVTFRNHRTF